jgi:hypothetical protein
MLADLGRAVDIMDQTGPLFDAFRSKCPQETTTARNFTTYYTYCRGNLRSKLLQAQAQEAIVSDDFDPARALLEEVVRLEESLYRTGLRDLAEWLDVYRDAPRVKALGLVLPAV